MQTDCYIQASVFFLNCVIANSISWDGMFVEYVSMYNKGTFLGSNIIAEVNKGEEVKAIKCSLWTT